MSATAVDTLMPVLEKIVRLESSTEPKHRAALEKLSAGLPIDVPLMWSYRRVAEFNVRRGRLEKALENNRAAVKEALAAAEAQNAANAWKWSQGRQAPNPEDAADVKRGRELIASLESQIRELTVASRVLVAVVEGIAEGERELKAIRDWGCYGGSIPSCVERDTAAKHAEMELEELPAWKPGKRTVAEVDPHAWIDDWNLPVPECAEEWRMPTLEDLEKELTPPPAPDTEKQEVIQQKPVIDRRQREGESRTAFSRRMLFKC
jgi:hypothetical protein